MLKGKSLIVAVFTFLINAIGAYSGVFSGTVALWLGLISFSLTVSLQSPIFSSGDWPLGWSSVMWVTNGVGIVIQLLNFMGDHAMIDPVTVNYIIVGINLFCLSFIKDYGTGSLLSKK